MSSSFYAARVPNVDLGSDTDLFRSLFDTWQTKHRRNMLRTVYYEGKNALKDFGIAVPPQMQNAFTPLQEIAKGVHAMTDRSVFEGFVSESGSDDPLGLAEILDANDFVSEFPMATVSSAVHACSFLTVTSGDVAAGEPEVLIVARSADSSAAKWDRKRRRLAGFLAITDVDDDGPTDLLVMTPDRVYRCAKNSSGRWGSSWVPNYLGEVPVSRLVLQPELNRPFGHSRISRTAMGLTDAMIRTLLRAEVSAEFYSAEKWWLFGADVSKFIGDDKWTALMGRMNAIDVDNPEQMPELHRFQGASPQPHAEQLRMLKSLFADDQQLEVRWADASNPSSADAIYAAKEELIMKTRAANRVWGRGAVKAMQLAVRLRDDVDVLSDEARGLSAQFTDPAIVSPSARADAFSKLSTSIPGFGESEVGMEFAGLSRDQIVRFKAEQQRAGASSRIAQLVEAARGVRESGDAEQGSQPAGDELTRAEVLKAKADALGVLRRAGVDAADAARLAGLESVKFIPGQPITIKSSEE